MKDIVTGKWIPQNNLVTGKPKIIGKEQPGFTGEANPDLFEGEVTDRLYKIIPAREQILKYNTATPTLTPSINKNVAAKMEELTGKAFDRLNSYIQKYNGINDVIEEGRVKKLGDLMRDTPEVDYLSFGKAISADFKSSKIEERLSDPKAAFFEHNAKTD